MIFQDIICHIHVSFAVDRRKLLYFGETCRMVEAHNSNQEGNSIL